MKKPANLIAVDGANGRALLAVAQRLTRGTKPAARLSQWDASGVFEQLLLDPDGDERLSPRLLLLLFAADLAFRLRWEITPLLASGRPVVAAPYVDTAIAFGRACDLPAEWLEKLFAFAPRPGTQEIVDKAVAASARSGGFVEFACARLRPKERRRVAAATRKTLSRPRSRQARRRR